MNSASRQETSQVVTYHLVRVCSALGEGCDNLDGREVPDCRVLDQFGGTLAGGLESGMVDKLFNKVSCN